VKSSLTRAASVVLLVEPLNKSYAGATLAFRDEMREARRSEWLTPFASRATKQIA
jgi:hypothetical protein